MPRPQKIPFITFYSYKGGSGRTVCAANTLAGIAKILGATPDTPLLIADFDIDSAGLTNWLGPKISDDEEREVTVHAVLNREIDLGNTTERQKFREGLIDITSKISPEFENRTILLLPGMLAGRGKPVIPHAGEKFRKQLGRFSFCGLVLDSASGRQDIARWCQNNSDVIVYCSRLSKQHSEGTHYDVRRMQRDFEKRSETCPPLLIAPVAVPREDVTREDLVAIRAAQIRGLRDIMPDWSKWFLINGIPEVERFKFGECVLTMRKKLSEDEDEALKAYNELAELIKTNLNLTK